MIRDFDESDILSLNTIYCGFFFQPGSEIWILMFLQGLFITSLLQANENTKDHIFEWRRMI